MPATHPPQPARLWRPLLIVGLLISLLPASVLAQDAPPTNERVFTVSPTSDQGWGIHTDDPAFTTPDWAKNVFIYQIFRDHFCQLRTAHSYLHTNSWETFVADGGRLYVFGRKDANEAVLVAVNRSPISQTVTLTLTDYLPVGAVLIDAASGQTATVSLTEVVQPTGFRIWHTEDGIDLTRPAAPIIEGVVEGSGAVTLTVAIPPLTSRVEIERSLVEGCFAWVGRVEASDRGRSVTFVDEGLANGQPVCYRAVAFNDVGLASEASTPFRAIPRWAVADARLVEPPAVEPSDSHCRLP